MLMLLYAGLFLKWKVDVSLDTHSLEWIGIRQIELGFKMSIIDLFLKWKLQVIRI